MMETTIDNTVHPKLRSLLLKADHFTSSWVVSLLLLAPVVFFLYQRYLSPLAKVPGPALACCTNLWWLATVLKRNQHEDSIRLHEKYGPLVRVGPNHVMVADLNGFKTIYGAGNKFSKSDFYKPFKARLKWSLTAEQDDRVHAFNRRHVARAYSMDALRTLEPYVDRVICYFLNTMNGLTDQAVNLGDWLQLFAYDSITEVSFSERFGYIDNGDSDGILALSRVVTSSGAWVGVIPWLYQIHRALEPIFGNWLGVTMRSVKFRALTAEKVKQHETRDDNHRDILSYLKEVREKKPDEFTDYALVGVLTSNIFAGSDTTAIALRAMIYFLLKNPPCLKRFLDELNARRQGGLLSDPVSFEEAERWPYLQAVMYEAMRLHPPFGVHLPRVVPPEGMVVNGTFIPPKTVVGSNAWVIHRNKEAFGDDVNEFRPERWLDPAKKGDMQRYFFSFGGGARTCLGKNVVWLEMSKFLPTLFIHFDLKLVDQDKQMPIKNLMLAFQDGPIVTIQKTV